MGNDTYNKLKCFYITSRMVRHELRSSKEVVQSYYMWKKLIHQYYKANFYAKPFNIIGNSPTSGYSMFNDLPKCNLSSVLKLL